MRKITILFTAILLTLSFVACGRQKNTPTETAPIATMPTIDPTMGTNIPDPEVDTTLPQASDPSGFNDAQTEPTAAKEARRSKSYR